MGEKKNRASDWDCIFAVSFYLVFPIFFQIYYLSYMINFYPIVVLSIFSLQKDECVCHGNEAMSPGCDKH